MIQANVELASTCNISLGEKPTKDVRKIFVKSFMGYPILIGRNAFSNETLINEHRGNCNHKLCLWFHAICSKGPHVILCIYSRKEPDEIIMRNAASYALQNIKSDSREVLYAPLQDVYKPSDSPIGVFRTWRTTTIVL